MKLIQSFFSFSLIFVIASSASASPQWKGKMHQVRSTTLELLTDLSLESKLSQKKVQEKIKKNGQILLEYADDLKHFKTPSKDPTLKEVSKRFLADVKIANQEIKHGYFEEARRTYFAALNHCFTCHSRNGLGSKLKISNSQIKKATQSSLEAGILYAATRSYDKAIDQFMRSFSSKHVLDRQKSIHHALTLAIRVKNDPKLAKKVVLAAKASLPSPKSIEADHLRAWQQAIGSWNKKTSATLENARLLYAQGKKRQSYPMDDSALVEYLRSSALLHTILDQKQNASTKAEALLLLGQLSEVLGGIYPWELNENYYESCIYAKPQTDTAKSCYLRLHDSIHHGFTGTSGTHIPVALKEKMKILKKIAGL